MAKGKCDDSYEDMCGSKPAYEQSEVPAYNPPKINEYEANIPSPGFDQSGFKK
jgi:hypothetical protein